MAGTNPKRRTWIAYGPDKNDSPDTVYHVIIRNNVALDLPREGTLPRGVEMDHNLHVDTPDDFADNFVKFDPMHFAYDMHPSKGSDAKGKELCSGDAPATDIEGKPRGPQVDIGAYKFQSN